MDIINKINDEDYAIILRPHLDKYFKWTGEVSVDVMTSERNSLEDEDAEGGRAQEEANGGGKGSGSGSGAEGRA